MWLTLLLAFGGLAASASLSWEPLQQQGLLWVLGVVAGSVALLLKAVHQFGRRAKVLWPERVQDARAAFSSFQERDNDI